MSREFNEAMRAGDLDRARSCLPDLSGAQPDSLLRSVADFHMTQQAWAEAGDALERMKYRNVSAEMNRKLCRNLAAMRIHRPGVYHTLVQVPAENSYSIAPSKTGHPTILFHKPDGATISLSADNDPVHG